MLWTLRFWELLCRTSWICSFFDAIDFHGKFDGAIDSPDGPAAFLGGIGDSAYGHRGSGNYIARHLAFANSILQSIFMVILMMQSIFLTVLQHL